MNDNEIIGWGLASSVEEYRKKEEKEKERMLTKLRQEAAASTPELDRELLKKHVPEIYDYSNNSYGNLEEKLQISDVAM